VIRHFDDVYRSLSPHLEYGRSDVWQDEVLERKSFMRRAFYALSFNGIEGDYAEFGSNSATTFRLAHRASRLVGHRAHLWAFDSFEGLPPGVDERDEHPAWIPGTMATSEGDFRRMCAEAGIGSADYTTVAGFYRETLRPDAPDPRPSRIALAYIDCDLYSSTLDVLRFLSPRLANGMILAFDDYYCYAPDAVPGERRAAAEVFHDLPEWRLVPFIQFGWHGMSFIVERRDLLTVDPTDW
jgi:hypothetical protein